MGQPEGLPCICNICQPSSRMRSIPYSLSFVGRRFDSDSCRGISSASSALSKYSINLLVAASRGSENGHNSKLDWARDIVPKAQQDSFLQKKKPHRFQIPVHFNIPSQIPRSKPTLLLIPIIIIITTQLHSHNHGNPTPRLIQPHFILHPQTHLLHLDMHSRLPAPQLRLPQALPFQPHCTLASGDDPVAH